uniref:Ig-like domain-containing protein n=2 Tax=Sphenodon punctatus TaxID=8508 RepID=A0A8D0HLY1_SPHPU
MCVCMCVYSDPPRNIEVNMSRARKRDPELFQDSPRRIANGSQLVAEEDDSLQLLCTVDGNPPANLSWGTGDRDLGGPRFSPNGLLELLTVTSEHSGEYRCQAQNIEGSLQWSFHLYVQYRPRPGTVNSTCRQEGDGLHCTCSLRSQPRPQIQWQVEGETLAGNRSSGALQVISWAHGDEATSSLSWPGSQDGGRSILCVGSNPIGVHTLHFILSPSGTGASSVMVGTAALCGVVITASLFLLGLCLIRFWKHKKAPVKAVAGVEVQPAKGKEQTVDDASLIYSNIPPR